MEGFKGNEVICPQLLCAFVLLLQEASAVWNMLQEKADKLWKILLIPLLHLTGTQRHADNVRDRAEDVW